MLRKLVETLRPKVRREADAAHHVGDDELDAVAAEGPNISEIEQAVWRQLAELRKMPAINAAAIANTESALEDLRIRRLDAALWEAIEIARTGQAALVFSGAWSTDTVVQMLVRAESLKGADDGGPNRGAQEQLAAASRRLVNLPIWVDEMPLTLHELRARIRKFATEWQTYTEDGQPAKRLALLVLDGWPGSEELDGWPESEEKVDLGSLHQALATPELRILKCGWFWSSAAERFRRERCERPFQSG